MQQHFIITLDMGLVTYEIDASSEDAALDRAEEWYAERKSDILHINRPKNDKISTADVYALKAILDEILDHAKEEPYCTDAENAFLSECQNAREACSEYTKSLHLPEN